MVLSSAQRKTQFLLLFTYLCLWCTDNTSIYVKAENIDSLKPGDQLNASTKSMLCSKQHIYCMNFDHDPDRENLTYLSIFRQGRDTWLVWVANRNQPADKNSAVLSLDYSGVPKIESKIGDPIILYASPQPFNNSNIIATLLDTGNFVLQDVEMKTVLWQSFDHPTDSLLPSMKLGVNHKTGHKSSLFSRISDTIHAPGPFRLDWEPTRKELVIRRREKVYWRSGKLKNNTFEYISGKYFKVKAVSNENEEYFSYTTPNEDSRTVWTLLQIGQLIDREGNDHIGRADMCYGYNTNDGCQKWGEAEIPTCRNPGDKFESKTVYPNENIEHDILNASYGISDCQDMCRSNCSCFGFENLYDNGTGCVFLVSTEGLNIAGSGNYKFYMLVKNNTDHKGMYIRRC